MISRKKLFGNPRKAHARISPDGRHMAYLAPVDGVLNIWVGPTAAPEEAGPVTQDTHRGIRAFFWAYTNQHVLYSQDTDGDEDWHIYRVDVDSEEIVDLTPIEKIAARIQGVSPRFPEEILVGINDRDARLHDVYRVHIGTGDRTLVQENPGFAGFMCDETYRVRFALTFTPEAGHLYLKPDPKEGWKEFAKIDPLDAMTTHPMGFDKSGDRYYLLDSRGRDKIALKAVDLESGQEELLAESEQADIDGAIVHPRERNVQAVTFTHARQEWKILDPDIHADIEYLAGVADGELQITSRTLDDRQWTVAYTLDTGPVHFYLYDRQGRDARFLFTSQPELEETGTGQDAPASHSGAGWAGVGQLFVSPGPQRSGR